MNKLTQHVKRSMLRYPTLFQNRQQVLVHLYLVLGNGFDWVDGELIDSYEDDAEPTMRYEDITDEVIEAKYSDYPYGEDFIASVKEKAAVERAAREERAANIDALARSKTMTRLMDGHYERPESIIDLTNNGYLFAKMPTVVESSYRDGAVEILNEVIYSRNGTEDEIAMVCLLRDAIKNHKPISKLVPPSANWALLDQITGVMKRHRFAGSFDGSNGAGLFKHWKPRRVAADTFTVIADELTALGLIPGDDGLSWEAPTGRVKCGFVIRHGKHYPRALVISHPDDPQNFLDGLARGYDDYHESAADRQAATRKDGMRLVDIEIELTSRDRFDEFIRATARAIIQGYGAGNNSPESVSFFSTHVTKLQPGWLLIRLRMHEGQSKSEMADAVYDIEDTPTGVILDRSGKEIGTWEIVS